MAPDLDGWMYKLAKAAVDSDERNHVFVMRKVLTEVYMRGFEDGQSAERRDQFTVGQVKRINAEHAAEKEETQ